MFDKGFFGDLFDFNNDGKLDMFEQAADFAAFQNMVKQSELEENGLDYDEIELMDEGERKEALEAAGLDSDNYDIQCVKKEARENVMFYLASCAKE